MPQPSAILFVAETEMARTRGFGLHPAFATETECGSSDGEHDGDQNKTAALAHFGLRQYQAEQCAQPRDGLWLGNSIGFIPIRRPAGLDPLLIQK
jgi:hypothetical protein